MKTFRINIGIKVLFVSATEVGISGSYKKKLILGEQPLNTVYVLQKSKYILDGKNGMYILLMHSNQDCIPLMRSGKK